MELSYKVDAAIVGAQKSGTTTLAAVLGRHPSICLAKNKEAHIFDQADVQRGGVSDTDISTHFPHREPGQILLDATPAYLYLPGCLEALLRHSPLVKIIVVLRPPHERALSHHDHERRLGYEKRTFLSALASERRLLRTDSDPLAQDSAHRHFSYRDRGRYVGQLERLRRLTPHHHVVAFRDLLATPQQVIDDVCSFLCVEPMVLDELPHLNAGETRHSSISRLVARISHRSAAVSTEQLLSWPKGKLR